MAPRVAKMAFSQLTYSPRFQSPFFTSHGKEIVATRARVGRRPSLLKLRSRSSETTEHHIGPVDCALSGHANTAAVLSHAALKWIPAEDTASST